MDTRTKILDASSARSLNASGLVIVTGYFDLLRAAHVGQLETIRQRTGAGTLLAAVMPWDQAVLNQHARAEMVAALRVIDYVVAIGESDLAALLDALRPCEVVQLEASHAAQNRQLIEHVRRRNGAA